MLITQTHVRPIKEGTTIKGYELFYNTNDPKEPKRRIAYSDVNGTSGTHKCGGKIQLLVDGILKWKVCGKCCADIKDY